jgi:CheY-like chemotaxis protein
MNSILIIDDQKEFVDAFITKMSAKGISVATARSFEGLQKEMPKLHHKIAVVILDIKCLISDNQEVENEDFILTAITYLEQNYPKFPRIILTGDDESFIGFQRFNKNEEVFLKGQEDELFDRIKCFCDNSENLKIKREYSEIFEIFENKWMNAVQEIQMLNILKSLDEQDSSKFGGILRNVRAMQEAIYKEINKKDKAIIPDDMFEPNGKIIWNKLMKHLIGKSSETNCVKQRIPDELAYKNQTIFNFAESLYWSSGQYIHTTPSYMISNYALKSLIYNLLELMIWAKQYLK